MKKKSYKNWIYTSVSVFVSLAMIYGCGDFLDEEPRSNIGPDRFFLTEDQAIEATNQIYDEFHRPNTYWGYSYQGHFAWDLLTDDFTSTGATTRLMHFFLFDAAEPNIKHVYNTYYNILAPANTVITRVPNMDIDPQIKERCLAEAHYLRAWSLFNLVQLFGDVAMPLEETEGIENIELPRISSDLVYDQIIADLQYAEGVREDGEDRLPSAWDHQNTSTGWKYGANDRGKITQGAAKSLLGKVYLTRAGAPLNGGAEYYELARQKLGEVIELANTGKYPYGLQPTYDDVFLTRGFSEGLENHQEVIFDLQLSLMEPNKDMLSRFWLPAIGELNKCCYGTNMWGFMIVNDNLLASFESDDVRRQHADDSLTLVHKDTTISFRSGLGVFPACTKHTVVDYLGDATTATSTDKNWIIYRYADVLLMYAEVLNELGQTGMAHQYINMTRNRAGLSNLMDKQGYIDGQDAFRHELRDERRHEFYGEHYRLYDLRRWGIHYETMMAMNEEGQNMQPHHELHPIPIDNINANPLLRQNDGY